MKSIGVYFRREQKRFRFYQFSTIFLRALTLLCIFILLYQLAIYALPAFKVFWKYSNVFRYAFSGCGVFIIASYVILRCRGLRPPSLAEIGSRIEQRAISFNAKKHRGELRSVGFFLESNGTTEDSRDFREAHLQFWNKRIVRIYRPLLPPMSASISYGVFALVTLSLAICVSKITHNLPTHVHEWMPAKFEIRGPYDGAPWEGQTGALSGIQGSEVRFEAPQHGSLKTFLYVKESGKDWLMIPCEGSCDWVLRERGQYAVGTLFSRSSIFPLQVMPDEAPRSVLFVNVNGEFVPSASVQALNQEKLQMQSTASDDIRLTKIEIHHRSPQNDNDETIFEWTVNDSHFKKDFPLPLTGWKGGQHQIFIRAYDQFKSSDSSAVTILFEDEETMRAKRLADLRALIDEWVHVLADLLETQADKKLSEHLEKRLEGIQYPDTTDAPLIAAFVKELGLLSDRILRWAKYAPDFSQTDDLVVRAEKAILYGLSLIFQEKTGEIEATSDSLKNSQDQLSKLLEKIKKGEMDASSQELQAAFQKLAEQLAELQKKMRDLPSGPSDDLINREAMQAQVDESESLAKRIEEIQKQMAAGDNKGAMRELESLLNQLSILSKEMEHSLDQWKSNLDQGAMQSAERFQKKLEDLRKREEELAKKTENLKEKSQKLEAQNSKTWKPIQPEKIENLQKEYNDLKKQQEKVGQEFQQSTQDFDREMKGTEFEPMFRSEESKQNEQQISDRMTNAKDALTQRKGFDALSNEKEALELMKKLSESQQKMQQQMQQSGQREANTKQSREKVEILATESKSEKERRRKIMDSLQHKVDERYQKSHEQYFEEMLQR
jgi:hypothetical protein